VHAITVLREDHERIQSLLGGFSGNGNDPRPFEKLKKELTVHVLAEDNIFLPQVEDAIEDSRKTTEEFLDAGVLAGAREIVGAAYENHDEIRALLARGRAPDAVDELARLVGRQVELEESLYPEAEKVLEDEDFERIGDLIEHCKWQVGGLAQASLASSSNFRP
jgi:hypothetical protein